MFVSEDRSMEAKVSNMGSGSTNSRVIDQFGGATQLINYTTGEISTASEVLSNKVVVLYFSAQWCPPCRRFTPILKTIYNNLKLSKGPNEFEFVYCSMDNFTSEYKSYTSEMPWWCLPHQSHVVDKLRTFYKAEGIPHLCVLDKEGNLLCGDAVNEAMEDPEGGRFPWKCPKAIEEILPDTYVRGDGTYHPVSDLDGKYLMLYFSARWCDRCTAFTRKLTKAYRALKRTRDDFEILFVSSDRDRRSFKDFFSQMPFGAIPYGDRYAKNKLAKLLGIRAIPTVYMFGPRPHDGGNRPLINPNVREVFERGDYLQEFPFRPQSFGDINQTTEDINGNRFVIVFHEAGDDHEQEEIAAAIRSASEVITSAKRDGVKPIKVCWAFCKSGLCESLRSVLQLGEPKSEPTMVLLDIPDSGGYYLCEEGQSEITSDSILNFIKSPGSRLQI